MAINYSYPKFEIHRDLNRCINCRVCERQCANEVHRLDKNLNIMVSDESKCVDCQRCVTLCPTHALKIVKTNNQLRDNANWSNSSIYEIYRQANSGGVLLSSMGNPNSYPVYFDKILLNASQVTNPSIDPLREPIYYKDNLLKGYIILGNIQRAGIYTSLIRNKTPLDTIDFELITKNPSLIAFEKKERKKKLGGEV